MTLHSKSSSLERTSGLVLASAAAVSLLAAGTATADAGADRAAALEACTAAVASQFGVSADAVVTSRIQFRTRGGVIKLSFRANGAITDTVAVYCEYDRRAGEIREFSVN